MQGRTNVDQGGEEGDVEMERPPSEDVAKKPRESALTAEWRARAEEAERRLLQERKELKRARARVGDDHDVAYAINWMPVPVRLQLIGPSITWSGELRTYSSYLLAASVDCRGPRTGINSIRGSSAGTPREAAEAVPGRADRPT